MEFKFRAVDDRPPSFFPPPSGVSYFTEQALRASYSTTTEFRRSELLRNPSDVREAIQRELEKERIREEIIVAEITRKRMLEAEVRRELMIERALVLGRPDGFSAIFASPSPSPAMRIEPRLPLLSQSDGSMSLEERISRSLEERLGRSLEERIAFQARREVGNISLDVSPLQRTLEAAQTPEVKPPSEASKEKLIFMAKPDPNLSGTKRKAVTPPAVGASEHHSVASKKKPKEEWSCALCQVTATSERGLNEHLQGKKHKAKEAGLISQKTGKNSSTTSFPKKTGKPTKPAETTGTPRSEQGPILEKESCQVKTEVIAKNGNNKTEEASVQKTRNAGELDNKNDQPPLQKKQGATENSKKKDGEVIGQKMPKKVKKFKFWCEMCQIGAYSEVVMTTHKEGKKHMARVQELSQNGGAVLAPIILPLPGAGQKTNDAKVVAKEANEKTNENVDAVVDGSGSSSGAN
ncbi:hypothetical protein L1049_023218 [Liquidambar formosana]|uniref:U1-type domain-containing protein n=1 Tax=Liquidambar formosana TaxID=63359 RepID=A0AAP0REI0_LIQFO